MPVPWQDMHVCAAPFRLPRPFGKTELLAFQKNPKRKRWRHCSEELGYICFRTKSLFMTCLKSVKIRVGLSEKMSIDIIEQKNYSNRKIHTFTSLTNCILLNREFSCCSIIKIFKCHCYLMNNIFPLGRAKVHYEDRTSWNVIKKKSIQEEKL